MKILVTGSAGRVGRHIYIHLMKSHHVVGFDITPCSTADFIGDIRDYNLLEKVLSDIDIIIHTAALHAPHVGLISDEEFNDINIEATEQLALLGLKSGVKQFIFTSTTALYGYASTPENMAGWVTEKVTPQPKTIYHKSKITAENRLEAISKQFNLPVTVLQMSRCFPESADLMSVYRLTRGIDPRDVAAAHARAIEKRIEGFNRYIISGQTPFSKPMCQSLFTCADKLVEEYAPDLALEFAARGWSLPKKLDRVYDSSLAQNELGWKPNYSYQSVLAQLDTNIAEVLPVKSNK